MAPSMSRRGARRGGQRFVEAGGVAAGARAADRALLEAILGERRLPARAACWRTSGRWRALAADPCLRRPEAARRDRARGARRRPAGAADFAELQRRLRLRAALRDAAPGRARARLGDDRGGGARAVRRSPTPAWTSRSTFCDAELRARARASRAPTTARPSRFVVMAMGKLGGEELNFSSDVDVCYFYSTDAGAARATAARCTTTTPSCRGG